jgi:hypothetical protein
MFFLHVKKRYVSFNSNLSTYISDTNEEILKVGREIYLICQSLTGSYYFKVQFLFTLLCCRV